MSFEEWYNENYDEWAEGEDGIALKEELQQAYEAGMKADVHTDNSKVIAELEKENERLTVQYETLKLHDEEEIAMLKAQIYKMRCCDNCCHCNGGVTDEAGNSICDNCDDDMSEWEY